MLVPYSIEHFPLLQSWITDKEILFQYSGTYFHYPITQSQISNYLQRHPDRKFYIAYSEGNVPYAFGELIPKNNEPPRLARLLIGDPKLRGRGLGAKLVRELMEEAVRLFNPSSINLYVLAFNEQAIRCYRHVGFTFVEGGDFNLEFEGESYLVRKMRYDLHRGI